MERAIKEDSSNPSSFINDNDIYFTVVGGKNAKGNVYGLPALSKMITSKSAQPLVIQPKVVNQIQEMHETIQNLNVELMTKVDKEMTLEEQMMQLM